MASGGQFAVSPDTRLRHAERRPSRLLSAAPRRSTLPWTSRSARSHRPASALPQPLLFPTDILPSCLFSPGSARPTNLTPRQGPAARRIGHQRSSWCAPAGKSLHAGERLDAAAPHARRALAARCTSAGNRCRRLGLASRARLGHARRRPRPSSCHRSSARPQLSVLRGLASVAHRSGDRRTGSLDRLPACGPGFRPACPTSRGSLAPPSERAPDAGALVGRRSCPLACPSRPIQLGGSRS